MKEFSRSYMTLRKGNIRVRGIPGEYRGRGSLSVIFKQIITERVYLNK